MQSLIVGVLTVGGVLAASHAGAQTTVRPKHGCYRVVGADSINIRARPFSTSAVLATAKRGEVLVKWRRWCTLRGFWCPVQLGDIKGHSDKSFLEPAPCPPNPSTPL